MAAVTLAVTPRVAEGSGPHGLRGSGEHEGSATGIPLRNRECRTPAISAEIFDAAATAPSALLASHAEARFVTYACEGGRDGRAVDGGGLENH